MKRLIVTQKDIIINAAQFRLESPELYSAAECTCQVIHVRRGHSRELLGIETGLPGFFVGREIKLTCSITF